MEIKNDKRNTSGVKGVSYKKKDDCWIITTRCGKTNVVTQRKDFVEAVAVRLYYEQCFFGDVDSPARQFMERWVSEQKMAKMPVIVSKRTTEIITQSEEPKKTNVKIDLTITLQDAIENTVHQIII